MEQPLPNASPKIAAPRFYLTGGQPLRPEALLLAIAVAVGGVSLVAYGLGKTGHRRFAEGASSAARTGGATAGATAAAEKEADDDPSQIDTIVLGDPADAPIPAHKGKQGGSVHATILIHLPRFGDQVGLIPNTPAGHLLYQWLAAFNQTSPDALGRVLPNIAGLSSVEAQLRLRQQTGGFNLLSAKEVQPGILVFRLRDQTPSAGEVLGTLQVRANSNPARIATFSMQAVP